MAFLTNYTTNFYKLHIFWFLLFWKEKRNSTIKKILGSIEGEKCKPLSKQRNRTLQNFGKLKAKKPLLKKVQKLSKLTITALCFFTESDFDWTQSFKAFIQYLNDPNVY
eukprot:GHVP01004357.1.p2 GENE.GHVP01004357.1~~GHVP01004357.1.p2  ORF type:complete len:109 (+),score=14.31 GHVP01004357.1:171-497(+)